MDSDSDVEIVTSGKGGDLPNLMSLQGTMQSDSDGDESQAIDALHFKLPPQLDWKASQPKGPKEWPNIINVCETYRGRRVDRTL